MLDVTGLVALTDAAFEHFEGIKERVQVWLQSGLRRSLAGIQKLNMGLCSQTNPHGCCFCAPRGHFGAENGRVQPGHYYRLSLYAPGGQSEAEHSGRTQVTDSQPLRTCRAFRS